LFKSSGNSKSEDEDEDKDEDKDEDTTLSSSQGVSLDCVNCYATLKSDLVFSYSIKYGLNPFPYCTVSFLAELNVRFDANFDFVFEASSKISYKSTPIILAKFQPLLGNLLSSLDLVGIAFPLKTTFGMEIRYACICNQSHMPFQCVIQNY
jgi:hypothetical protein